MKVAEILAAKGKRIVSIRPAETVEALSLLLRENHIGAAVVSADGRTVDGVISERDIAYNVAKHGAKLHTMSVSALMTKTVITCTPDDDAGQVASTMLSRNIRHIPVVQGERLVGMVSIRDVLKDRVGELQQEAALLRSFRSESERPIEDR